VTVPNSSHEASVTLLPKLVKKERLTKKENYRPVSPINTNARKIKNNSRNNLSMYKLFTMIK
jgi:hypothetical protein